MNEDARTIGIEAVECRETRRKRDATGVGRRGRHRMQLDALLTPKEDLTRRVRRLPVVAAHCCWFEWMVWWYRFSMQWAEWAGCTLLLLGYGSVVSVVREIGKLQNALTQRNDAESRREARPARHGRWQSSPWTDRRPAHTSPKPNHAESRVLSADQHRQSPEAQAKLQRAQPNDEAPDVLQPRPHWRWEWWQWKSNQG